MSHSRKQWHLQSPPYRSAPESVSQIMVVTLIVMILPGVAATGYFGYHAVMLILTGGVFGAVAEKITAAIRKQNQAGSMSHSILMGVLCSFTLPAESPWYVAAAGASAGVLIGKQFFGGLGRYLWHPALIGRLVVQMFFYDRVTSPQGLLLAKPYLFFGDLSRAGNTVTSWCQCNWLVDLPTGATNGWLLTKPLTSLRHISQVTSDQQPFDLGRFLLDNMPDLKQLIFGAAPGGLGETCGIALIIAGVYLIYRGYMHWQLPVYFLLSAWVSAGVLPISIGANDHTELLFPLSPDRVASGLTYMNYHIFSGGLLLGSMVMMADTTCRPITAKGQSLYAIACGVLTIVFTNYTTIPIPCYAAILAVSTFVPTLDRLTRPGRV